MAVLEDYAEFKGRHWETGSVRNYFAYRGVKAPHTNEAYSEALLMGVSGGAVMGYFIFSYAGFDPMARILTRNTFDPLNTLLSRLGISQHTRQTASEAKGVVNLLDTLDSGVPAILWADMYSMPYNGFGEDEKNWVMFPLLVYGYDADANCAWIADRAKVPLTVTTGELQAARGRVKKYKYRIVTLDPPNIEKLPSAVDHGIRDCISLFTEKPPKGSSNNFGLAAFKWLELGLSNPKSRRSWEKEFPPGRAMYAGLTSIYSDINHFGVTTVADRALYANFLDEASVILTLPGLKEAASQFRMCAGAWEKLNSNLLPESIPLFQETRSLLDRQHAEFINRGAESLDERHKISQRLIEIRAEIGREFPLSRSEINQFRENLAEVVFQIHDAEKEAVAVLQDVMG